MILCGACGARRSAVSLTTVTAAGVQQVPLCVECAEARGVPVTRAVSPEERATLAAGAPARLAAAVDRIPALAAFGDSEALTRLVQELRRDVALVPAERVPPYVRAFLARYDLPRAG